MAKQNPRRKRPTGPFKKGRPVEPAALSARQLAETVAQGVAAADEAQAEAVSGLARLRRARGRLLDAERERLAGRPGAEARVERLDRAAAANARTVAALDAQTERARVEVPDAEDGVYRVYGLVRAQDGRPAAEHTVILTDDDGDRVREAGHACTDDEGRFALTWKGIKGQTEDPTGKVEARVFVCVSNPEGDVVAGGRRALAPRSGGVDYVEVTAGPPRARCADPSTEKREEGKRQRGRR
jgi:hypothetical protein